MVTRRLFVNGIVHTMEPASPRAEAVAVEGSRFAAVGTPAEARAAVPGAEEVGLGGRFVLPGFIDAHNHYLVTGESMGRLDVRYPGVRSIEDLVLALSNAAASTSAGQWIRAWGFDHAKYEQG